MTFDGLMTVTILMYDVRNDGYDVVLQDAVAADRVGVVTTLGQRGHVGHHCRRRAEDGVTLVTERGQVSKGILC